MQHHPERQLSSLHICARQTTLHHCASVTSLPFSALPSKVSCVPWLPRIHRWNKNMLDAMMAYRQKKRKSLLPCASTLLARHKTECLMHAGKQSKAVFCLHTHRPGCCVNAAKQCKAAVCKPLQVFFCACRGAGLLPELDGAVPGGRGQLVRLHELQAGHRIIMGLPLAQLPAKLHRIRIHLPAQPCVMTHNI